LNLTLHSQIWRFEDAGEMLSTRIEPNLADPNIDALIAGTRTRMYDDTSGSLGPTIWLDDRRAMTKRRAKFRVDTENLLSKLLLSLDSSVFDKLRADPTYDALRANKDLLGIYKLLEVRGKTSGAGVHSVAAASMAFHQLSQIDRSGVVLMSYERYVLNFKETLRSLNGLIAHPMDNSLVTSKFILGLDNSDCAEEIRILMKRDTMPTLEEAITSITRAKSVDATISLIAGNKAPPPSKVKGPKGEDVTANVVKVAPPMATTANQQKKVDWTCYNCGLHNPDHQRGSCNKPAIICSNCGKKWHKLEFHDLWMQLKVTKSKKCKVIDDEVNPVMYVTKTRSGGEQNHNTFMTVKDRFIGDSGCTRTVCQRPDFLTNPKILDAGAIKVEGFTEGLQCIATHSGSVLQGMDLPAICVPTASDNLFSLTDIASRKGSFYGDEDGLRVYQHKQIFAPQGPTLIHFEKDIDGLWACSPDQVIRVNVASVTDFTKEEQKRALEARQLHLIMRHPNDQVLVKALDLGSFANCGLTASDIRNAAIIYGPCEACLSGKMTSPTNPSSSTVPVLDIGSRLHVDPVEYTSQTMGGNKFCLIAVDEKSDFVTGLNMKHSTAGHISQALVNIFSKFNSFGHKIRHVLSDHGSNLVAAAVDMGLMGVTMATSVPGQHTKRVERKIRTIKDRERAVLSSLPYKLPEELYGELRANVIESLNMLPSSSCPGRSPLETVTGVKPDLSMISQAPFGTVGLFYDYTHQGGTAPRAEYGIVVGWHHGTKRAVRAYFPGRKKVMVRQKFTVLGAIPPEWGWSSQVAARSLVTVGTNVSLSDNTFVQRPDIVADDYISMLEDSYASSFSASSTFSLDTDYSTDERQEALCVDTDATASYHSEIDGTPTQHVDASVVVADADVEMDDTDNVADMVPLPTIVPQIENTDVYHRYPTRARNSFVGAGESTKDAYSKFQANVTVHFDRHLHAEEAHQAIVAELKSLTTMDVMTPVSYECIHLKEYDCVLPTHMFVNDKYTPDNVYEKTKARLCVGGNKMDPNSYGETSSKMANVLTTNIQMKIAAALDEEMCIYDIKCAYLHTRMEPDSKSIYVKLAPSVTKTYLDLFPSYQSLVHHNCLYMKLNAYMYGLPAASLMFQKHLEKFLTDNEFVQSKVDECFFVKYDDAENYMRVSVHVDDMLVTGKGVNIFRRFEEALSAAFTGHTKQSGDRLSYLGTSLIRDRNHRVIKKSQIALIESLLERMGMSDCNVTDMPYGSDILESDEGSPPCNREEFLSLVMTMLFIARMSRYDIMWIVNYLATKSACPSMKYWEAAKRVLRYLKGTLQYHLVLIGSDLTVDIMADASHALHDDSKGHSGIQVRMGGNVVYCISGKQKVNTISSTETELMCVRDAVTYVPYILEIFSEMRIPVTLPVTIFQDNTSTIEWTNNGAKFRKAKHLMVALHFVRDFVQKNTVRMVHRRTEEMDADYLTKPVVASLFKPAIVMMFST